MRVLRSIAAGAALWGFACVVGNAQSPVTTVPTPSAATPTPNSATTVVPSAGTPAVAAPVLKQVAAADWPDTARFLAGMSVADSSPLAALNARASIKRHRKEIEPAFVTFNERRMVPMQRFAARELSPLAASSGPVFYPFSGPDALHALALFPKVDDFVFTGLEPVGEVPDLAALDENQLRESLYLLRQSLGSVLLASFFKTHEMKVDLRRNVLEGVTPIIALFLARHDMTVTGVDYLIVDATGAIRTVAPSAHDKLGATELSAVRVRFTRPDAPGERRITYFSADISNSGLEKTPQYLEYIQKLGFKTTLVKSASYLMHMDAFSKVRGFIVDRSAMIVQDDSGVPWRFFAENDWQHRFYGQYNGPIPMFANRMQKDMRVAYQSAAVVPINFVYGYNFGARGNTLMRLNRKINVADNR